MVFNLLIKKKHIINVSFLSNDKLYTNNLSLFLTSYQEPKDRQLFSLLRKKTAYIFAAVYN